jgi:hypothetical protein
MSVAPEWKLLPAHRIPRRLATEKLDARGKNEDACFRLGYGPFEDSVVTTDLYLRRDSDTHGSLEPAYAMPLDQYQTALASTRELWDVDEGA